MGMAKDAGLFKSVYRKAKTSTNTLTGTLRANLRRGGRQMKYTPRSRRAPARICDTKSGAHNSGKIIVINYHLLSDYAGGAIDPFCVSSAAFVKQLNVIKEKEIPVVCLAALINGTFAGDFGVILTFDDGNVSDFHIAVPALQERHL